MDPVAAGLAATLVSAEDIARLEAAAAECEQLRGDPDAFTAASIGFHELVIECSRNRVLLAQFRAMRSVLQPLVRPKTTDDVMRRLTRSNKALLRALADHDAVEAARLMRERVSAIRISLLGAITAHPHEGATMAAAAKG
jgi:GntR family transcriptional regulator, transcriptional repressor for pyruvate dehydrogenase complex